MAALDLISFRRLRLKPEKPTIDVQSQRLDARVRLSKEATNGIAPFVARYMRMLELQLALDLRRIK